MCDPEWDDEVDVVCTDVGLAGLATAISAVDGDAEVFLAALPAARPRAAHWFEAFRAVEDDETSAYIHELTADIELAAVGRGDGDLPVRVVGDEVPPRRRPVPPFEGWRLRDWAARCIPSPTGYLYTQVTDWPSDTMDCGAGDLVKVTEIGTATVDSARPIASIRDWLAAEAAERGLTPQPVARFDRLVLEEGFVSGAVFTTESGPMTVRARHGVLICRDHEPAAPDTAAAGMAGGAFRVALVGKEASRFGRVELLAPDSATAN